MKDGERRKLEKFERQVVFANDNGADFPDGSMSGDLKEQLSAVVTEIHALAASQTSGFGDKRQAYSVKQDAEDDLRDDLYRINQAARVLVDTIPGVEAKFRLPYSSSDEALLAAARAFHADAAPHAAQFISCGLPADFLADLLADINRFESSGDAADSGLEKHGAATGGISDAVKRATAIAAKLEALNKIKYGSNPAKLSAWKIASHLERPPKKQSEPQPTP